MDDDKITNELTGKAKCVYDKLNSSSTNFKAMIKKFDGDFPVSHLKLTINNNLGSSTYGKTIPPVNYITEIQINGNKLSNLSDLGAATTFAHEIIHAEIFRKMLSAAQKGDLNTATMTAQQVENYVNSLQNNFLGLYDYYVKRYKPTWNHNMMAQHYRSTIADIAQKFDRNAHIRQVYEDISWAGLRILEDGTNSIAWKNLSTTEQQRALRNLSKFFHNGTNECN